MSEKRDLEANRAALRRARERAPISEERLPSPEEVQAALRGDPRKSERGDAAEAAREETMGFDVETRGEARAMDLTRRSRHDRDVEGISFPERLKKPGWDYQGMPVRIMNADNTRVDEAELIMWEDQGWRPCLVRDYPTLAARGANPDSAIETRGIRWYTRPKHLTLEAQEEDFNYAEQQRRDRTVAAATGGGGDGIPGDRRGLVRVPEGVRVEGGRWGKG